jgi:hypothetical protein
LAGDIDRLVLWDPIVNGANYLTELEPEAIQGRMGDRFFAPVQGHGATAEIRGRVVSSAFVEGLRAVDLCSEKATAPSTTLTIFSQRPPANCARLQRTQIVTVETVLPWQDIESESGILPIQVYERILEWLR